MTFKGEENFTDVMGWHQSAYGAGMVIGPVSGSLVFGMFGYEMTMIFYALLATVSFIMAAYMLPDSLDESESDSPRSGGYEQQPEEQELLNGYNKIMYDEIGIMTVIYDRICFLSYL